MLNRRQVLLSSAATLAVAADPGSAIAQVAPTRGGVLRMLLATEPPILNSGINTSLWAACVTSKVMEGLITYDLDMTMRPQLAESFEISPDTMTLRFNLRRNVKWHDGEPFTSADVKFTVEEIWKKAHPRGRTIFANVTEVETPDAHTAIIRQSRPTPMVLTFLNNYEGQILPRHIFSVGEILQHPRNNSPIGTGPFRFKEWRRGQFIELERNPDYWDAGKPYLDGIIARMVPDGGARVAAFETGEVFYGPFSPTPTSEVARLRQNPNLVVETRGYDYFAPVQTMEINTRNGPLANPQVRRALRVAIDSNFIAENVWFGMAKPINGMMHSSAPHRATDLDSLAFSPQRANQMLDEAGFRRPSARENRFSLRIYHGTTGENPRTAEYLRQAFARVGVEARLETSDLATMIRRVYTDYDFDMTITTLFFSPDPTIGLQRFTNPAQAQRGVPFGNATGFTSEEMTRLWREASSEPDKARATALFQQVQRLQWAAMPILNLVEPSFFSIANRRFHNHTKQQASAYDTFADAFISPGA